MLFVYKQTMHYASKSKLVHSNNDIALPQLYYHYFGAIIMVIPAVLAVNKKFVQSLQF